MKTYLVDTNFFIRYLLEDNKEQTKIIHSHFEKAENGEIKIVVPFIVFFEIEYVLRKTLEKGKSYAVNKIRQLLKVPFLVFEEKNLLEEAISLYERINADFTDCYIFSKAHLSGFEILSFDKDFKKLVK